MSPGERSRFWSGAGSVGARWGRLAVFLATTLAQHGALTAETPESTQSPARAPEPSPAAAPSSAAASARSPASTAAFDYQASPGCPSQEAFVEAITSRFADESPDPLIVRMNTVLDSVIVSGRLGRVVIRYRGKPAPERTVQGADCDEATAAAAVIVAIGLGLKVEGEDGAPTPSEQSGVIKSPALSDSKTLNAARGDSESGGGTRVPPERPKPEASKARRFETGRRPPKTGAAEPGRAVAPRTLPADETRRTEPPQRASSSSHRTLSVGAAGGVHTLLGPGVQPELDASVELVSESWSVGLMGGYSHASIDADHRRALFDLWLGRIQGCLALSSITDDSLVRACGHNDIGALGARGDESSTLARGQSAQAFWAAFGASVGVVGPAVYGGVRFLADAGVILPVVRYDFALQDPNQRVLSVPTWGCFARLGVAAPIFEVLR